MGRGEKMEDLWVCSICSATFYTLEGLREHKKTGHLSFKCGVCGTFFRSDTEMENYRCLNTRCPKR